MIEITANLNDSAVSSRIWYCALLSWKIRNILVFINEDSVLNLRMLLEQETARICFQAYAGKDRTLGTLDFGFNWVGVELGCKETFGLQNM